MLYRECRFNAAAEIIREVDPSLTSGRIFQILGGLNMQLCKMEIKNTPFYIIEGCCPKLSFDVFFKHFDIKYDECNVKDLIENFEPDKYIYVIPIANMLLENENKLDFSDRNMGMSLIGHSYAIIKKIDFENKKIILKGLSLINDNTERWISLELYNNIIEEIESEIYSLKIHCISKKELQKNQTLQNSIKENELDTISKNLTNALKDEISSLDNATLKGQQVYTMLCQYVEGLLKLYKKNNQDIRIEKYIRMHLVYFRFFVASGTDTFYREEFIHSLEESISLNEKFPIDEWKVICSKWRKIGRLFSILHNKFTVSRLEELLNNLNYIREKEPYLINKTISCLSDYKAYE